MGPGGDRAALMKGGSVPPRGTGVSRGIDAADSRVRPTVRGRRSGVSSMKAIVLYDSVFGNTRQIVQSIADALASRADVELLLPAEANLAGLAGSELLVVGSPTRGFRPTEAIAAMLKHLGTRSLEGSRVAAFDTRLKADEIDSAGVRFIVRTGGYAAKRIADQLRRAGGTLIGPPEGFFVEDTEGPLKQGELARAAAWASQLMDAK